MKITISNREAGTAIVLVLSVLATLIVIVGVAAEYTTSVSRNVQRSATLESAVAVADGCIENSFAQWRKVCQAQPVPTTTALAAVALPTQAQFPGIANFAATATDYDPNDSSTVQQCKVIAVDPQEVAMDPDTPPTPAVGQAETGDNTFNYRATAYVTLPTLRGNVLAKVQRIFRMQRISPWNYAIFYTDPLEIHPGPDFNITGWVHTNGDLYTGHTTLHFKEKASFAGTWHSSTATAPKAGFMPADKSHTATNSTDGLPTWPMNPEIRPDFDSTHQPFNLDPFTFDSSNPNNTGYHELIEPPVLPLATNPDPLNDARYYNQADIIIEITDNADLNLPDDVKLLRPNKDGTATELTGPPPLGDPDNRNPEDKNLYDMFSANGVITTGQSLTDNRETTTNIRAATLDISKLTKNSGTQWNKAGSAFRGIIYIYDADAAANGIGKKRGIRLVNGGNIPTGGLTVASANPVYITGDYNTGSTFPPTPGATPPSNGNHGGNPNDSNGKPWDPKVAGYERQPCAVIADAINILSNSWNGNPNSTASSTTINSAIVSGIVPTGSDAKGTNYSGGAENFPRFLENWSGGKTLTYYGSMVELYRSQQAVGIWGKGNVYSAPTRQWYFDTNFRLRPPPGVLWTYTYSRGRWSLVP